MARTLTLVQRKGHDQAMHYTPREKHNMPDCSNCRNSRVELVKGRFAFLCKIGFAPIEGIAPTCPGYRDARNPCLINFLQTVT